MRFILEHQPRHALTVSVSIDAVLERIAAHSAWHAAHNPNVVELNADHRRLLTLSIEQGFADLRTRFAGYIAAWNWNPNSEDEAIAVLFKLEKRASATMVDVVADVMVEILAAHALMQFYGREASYFDASYRKHRAQLALLLCQP